MATNVSKSARQTSGIFWAQQRNQASYWLLRHVVGRKRSSRACVTM